MPLEKSSSGPAFVRNLKTELKTKPRDQALAIAYSIKRRSRADGGSVNDDDQPQVNIVKPAASDDFRPTTDAIASSYPTLQPYLKNLAIQRGHSSGPDDDRQLEFYQPWETDNPNPGKLTTELYNQNLQGQDLQDAVAGDMLHHLGTTDPSTNQPIDPTWMALKQQMVSAMGPDQKSMDQEAYQQEKSNPSYQTGSYDDWMQNNRADAYIRGALFPSQNPEWQEEGMYTPAMKAVTKKMKDYLTGNTDVNKRRGGSVNAAMDIARRVKRAKGGKVHIGPIIGDTGGRADKVPMKVHDGSYVVPADIISGLGEGNTLHGLKIIDAMFPRPRASGGKTQAIPIAAADGESVIGPEQLKAKFGGDLDHAHAAMDAWVKHERQKIIHTMSRLPGPAQD